MENGRSMGGGYMQIRNGRQRALLSDIHLKIIYYLLNKIIIIIKSQLAQSNRIEGCL